MFERQVFEITRTFCVSGFVEIHRSSTGECTWECKANEVASTEWSSRCVQLVGPILTVGLHRYFFKLASSKKPVNRCKGSVDQGWQWRWYWCDVINNTRSGVRQRTWCLLPGAHSAAVSPQVIPKLKSSWLMAAPMGSTRASVTAFPCWCSHCLAIRERTCDAS